jgi:hypothetical protein
MVDFSGWADSKTKSVAEYIKRDEALCDTAGGYMARTNESTGFYKDFIVWMELQWDETPDGVSWLDPALDYESLDKMMLELKK